MLINSLNILTELALWLLLSTYLDCHVESLAGRTLAILDKESEIVNVWRLNNTGICDSQGWGQRVKVASGDVCAGSLKCFNKPYLAGRAGD